VRKKPARCFDKKANILLVFTFKSVAKCRWEILIFALALSFLAGCAAQGGPGGGPTDRLGPQLIATFPSDGATNVGLEPEITLIFSETIDNRLNISAVQVTPPPALAPRLQIRHKQVTIKLAEPLQPDRTYIFNFGRNLKDYQNNPTAQQVKLAFATGDSLDEAMIGGRVTDIPANQKTMVWFFKKEAAFPDTLWNCLPDYIVSADNKGNYQATNLPVGEFRAMAVSGQSPRPKYLTENELMAVPQANPLIIESRRDKIENVDFRLTKHYLKPFRLLTANPLDGYLELNFSRPILDDSLRSDFFKLSDENTLVRQAWISEDEPTRIILLTDSPALQTDYQVSVSGILADNADSLVVGGRTARFNWPARPDTLKPKIFTTSPTANAKDVELSTVIQIHLSEPIAGDTLTQNIQLFCRDTSKVPVNTHWYDANTIVIKTEQPLLSAVNYSLRINSKYWQDFAGNKFQDSLVVLKFTTLDQNLFGSLTGKIIPANAVEPENLIVTATLAGGIKFERQTRPDSNGYYEFRELLPGKYVFAIWDDRNSDGKYDFGRLAPYRPAEPFRIYPNQINVRSRWETAEVNWDF